MVPALVSTVRELHMAPTPVGTGCHVQHRSWNGCCVWSNPKPARASIVGAGSRTWGRGERGLWAQSNPGGLGTDPSPLIWQLCATQSPAALHKMNISDKEHQLHSVVTCYMGLLAKRQHMHYTCYYKANLMPSHLKNQTNGESFLSPLPLGSPTVPIGHGCFATCPCRVLDHMISRASTASQLSAPTAGSWEEAGGRCVVISSGMSTAGDGVLVLRFRLPVADVVVVRPVLLVVTRGVVLLVVLPVASAPDGDTSRTK